MEFWGTIGPACANVQTLCEMVKNGMTGLRMNLSHGKLAEHSNWISMISEAGISDLLIDLQGPELRIGRLETPLTLKEGGQIRLVPGSTSAAPSWNCRPPVPADGDSGFPDTASIPAPDTSFPEIFCPPALLAALAPGQELLLDDGKILVRVTQLSGMDTWNRPSGYNGNAADCTVLRGGVLSGRKSIAAPGLTINQPTLTSEDLENLRLANDCGVTAVMLPFVRGRKDLQNLKQALSACGADGIRIYAKIENLEGAKHLPEFIHDADCIVIARGDLGNAMPLWELPGCQKRIAALCKKEQVPFMVVTQMLDSMINRAVPTRAEVCDIYNAVLDGADSVMLTGETAAGKYPAEAMKYLMYTARCALNDANADFSCVSGQ